MPAAANIENERFSRLVALTPTDERSASGSIVWECICDCGGKAKASVNGLKSGNNQSCGCAKIDHAKTMGERSKTHEMTGTEEYMKWAGIKTRCLNGNDKSYVRYGGRGITICSRWVNSFEAFYADMGDRPSTKHSIDRKDNDGHYSCGKCDECLKNGWTANCEWQTSKEQANNRRSSRRITHHGKTKTMSEWASSVGLSYACLTSRLYNGWTFGKAISTPLLRQGARP